MLLLALRSSQCLEAEHRRAARPRVHGPAVGGAEVERATRKLTARPSRREALVRVLLVHSGLLLFSIAHRAGNSRKPVRLVTLGPAVKLTCLSASVVLRRTARLWATVPE